MSEARRGPIQRFLHGLFGVYAWLAFASCVLFALIAVTIVPSLKVRRRLVRGCALAAFLLCGIRPKVTGIEHLPEGSSVVVANHASYVDGVLLKGLLPSKFSFVIKGEMRNIPVVHFLLRRGGSRFVERFSSNEGARDARSIIKAARGGESLGFFPEGTFLKEAGVSRFRQGAFMAAIKGQIPVVPIAIFGTRRMLSCGGKLPRPSAISIEILPPIRPGDVEFSDNKTLAEAARQRILAVLDEPDLLTSDNRVP